MERFMSKQVMSICLPAIWLAFGVAGSAQTSLVDGFKDPPNVARPRVYWYWQNGNITKEGLTKDLDWMHRAGIGGVETFDVAVTTPTVVTPRLLYMQPEWKDAFRHALELTDKLGMEVTIGAAPGWSQTGGPWVTPADAMKKLVWTETAVRGGQHFQGVLPKPPENNGPFRDQPHAVRADRPIPVLPTLFHDQRVIAFRVPALEKDFGKAQPTVTSSGGDHAYKDLVGGDFTKTIDLHSVQGRLSWVQIGFETPQTVRGVTVASPEILRSSEEAAGLQWLDISDDGVHFRRVADLPKSQVYERTYAFAPVTAKYFRYELPATNAETVRVSRFVLHAATPVHRFQEKDGFAAVQNFYDIDTVHAEPGSVVAKQDVKDLTFNMKENGTLDWTAPPGEWMVVRMGYSLTGQTNAPAPLEATGFEVDKMKAGATKTFMDDYLKLYEGASGGLMGKHGVNNVATDSWEAGFANWTDGMLTEFRRLRGYDAGPWLPALTGHIVQSSEATDRFLWDFRRTIADLVITTNFDQVRDSLHARGLGYVAEAMAARRSTIGDAMEMKARADVPMGELWLPTAERFDKNYAADIRDTASVAHIYGRKIASAESITSTGNPWGYGPWDIKSVADQEFLDGINQFTLHVSVHQPNDRAPGLALGTYGMWFNRLDTWAEQARAWTDYIARSSYMLQQGRAVVDVAYFYGQEGSSTTINESHAPEIEAGYNYDFVNSEALLKEFVVTNGKLSTRAGMQYKVLYLGGTSNRMTLPVLRQLLTLARAGAVVAGLPPSGSPTLADDASQWKAAVLALWPDASQVHRTGLGKVYRTLNLEHVLEAEHIQPDFQYAKNFEDASVKFYHRRSDDAEIYFVNNRTDQVATINADFRVSGKTAEIWSADRGTVQPASYTMHKDRTTVPLSLTARDAVFVVFRGATKATSRHVAESIRSTVAQVKGPWTVYFQPGRGAPKSVEFDELSDWSNSSDAGIKYFSGTATYTKVVDIPASALMDGAKIELGLGKVHEVAEVVVNGQTEGIAWKPPYRVDITAAVKPGKNTLSIQVINLWPNRLIGDAQKGAKQYAFAPNSTYTENSPLLPSGLIGPVVLERVVALPGTE
jgi:hypothetical protein